VIQILIARSTWNVCGNCDLILVTVRLYAYCIFQLMTLPSVNLPVRPATGSMLWLMDLRHLKPHQTFVRPGTSLATATQSLAPRVCTAPFSLLSSSVVQPPLRPLTMPICPPPRHVPTLLVPSTWKEQGDCKPIYPVLLAQLCLARIRNCTSQLCIFLWCPATIGLGCCSTRIQLCIRHRICIRIIIITTTIFSGRRRKTYRNVKCSSLSSSFVCCCGKRLSTRRFFLAGISSPCSDGDNGAAIF
jgi:hypothetical protein